MGRHPVSFFWMPSLVLREIVLVVGFEDYRIIPPIVNGATLSVKPFHGKAEK